MTPYRTAAKVVPPKPRRAPTPPITIRVRWLIGHLRVPSLATSCARVVTGNSFMVALTIGFVGLLFYIAPLSLIAFVLLVLILPAIMMGHILAELIEIIWWWYEANRRK